MNIGPLLNIDPVSMIKQFAGEVRQSRLFPIVVGLAFALVAIPVLLTSSASSIPTVPMRPLPVAAPPWTSVPALSVEPLAGQGRFSGAGRDPFKQQASAVTPTASGPTGRPAAAAGLASNPGAGGTPKLGSSGGAPSPGSHGSSGGSGGSSPSVSTPPVQALTPTPPPSLPSTPSAPSPPSGVGQKQSLAVAVAMSDPNTGDVTTINPVERLSILPNKQQPLLVELGVLEGNKRVAFAVQPGAVVSGPGTCIPGPTDCEVLTLPQEQVESLSVDSTFGVQEVTDFAVSSIRTVSYGSAHAAAKARRKASSAGRRLLNASGSEALSLFSYDPNRGVLIDQRNIKVGGS